MKRKKWIYAVIVIAVIWVFNAVVTNIQKGLNPSEKKAEQSEPRVERETPKAEQTTPKNEQSTPRTEHGVQKVDERLELGTKYESFVSKWGKPSHEIIPFKDGVGVINFKNAYYQTVFSEGKLSNLTVAIENEKGAGKGVSLEEAQRIAKEFLPKDIKSIRNFTRNTPPGRAQGTVYKSGVLARSFTNQQFEGVDPGTCFAFFSQHQNGQVFSILVALGDSP